MATDNLLGKLKRDFSTALTVGALVGTVYGCGEDGNGITDPPPPQNHTPRITLEVSPLSGVAPLDTHILYKCEDADGANDIAQSRLDVGSYTSGTTSLDSTFTFTNPGTYPAEAYCKDRAGAEASAGPIDVAVSPPQANNPPQTTLAVNPTSGVAPLEVRVQYACTDPDGANDIAQSYLAAGSDTLATTSIDSTFTFTNPGTYPVEAYCKDKAGAEASAGPIDVAVSPPPQPTEKIAFGGNRTNFRDHIFIGDLINNQLTNIQNLTDYDPIGPGLPDDYHPAWSPDGSKIAFTSFRDGNPSIYIMNADGTNQTRLTANVNFAWKPDWSPDGTQMAFSYIEGGFAGIGVINIDGSGFTKLNGMSCPSSCNLPGDADWSPDGSKIAYSYPEGNWEIYVMDADGSNQRNITNHSAIDGQPEWSPDGNEIVFTSWRGNGSSDLYLMNSDGSNIRRLTNDAGAELGANFSPDGSRIIFSYSSNFNPQIYLMNADGTGGWTQLTTGMPNSSPAWRPRQ